MNSNYYYIKKAFASSLDFINTLKCGENWKFLPCISGITPLGGEISLGFSCLALKTYYMLGVWDRQNSKDKNSWTEYIKSFQKKDDTFLGNSFENNSFMDRNLLKTIDYKKNIKEIIWKNIEKSYILTSKEKLILGETKQAIVTLLQVGDNTFLPYSGFFIKNEKLESFINGLDWHNSWNAGGLFSAYVTLLATSNIDNEIKEIQRKFLLNFLNKIVDKNTGCYSLNTTDFSEMINGAMKVLSALDHLETAIHYPKQLIDFCLSHFPPPESCFIVDYIYVLFRCSNQLKNKYKYSKITKCLTKILLPLIKRHYKKDGGFSYFRDRSQTDYYGANISSGNKVSDIHGTSLLIWALVMITIMLGYDDLKVKAIKP